MPSRFPSGAEGGSESASLGILEGTGGVVKRYSRKQVARTLAKYDLDEVEIVLRPDLRLRMMQTADAYALLDDLIDRDAGDRGSTRFPYWAETWPSAVGLARWFAGPDAPAADLACELGCGTGLVGVALARMGWRIRATDYVEDALLFATHNASRNGAGARHSVSYLDWRHPVGAPCRWLVGSDLAYEKSVHPQLERTVRALLEPGGRLVLSDPGRPAARPLLNALEGAGFRHRVESMEVEWKGVAQTIDIHLFIRPPEAGSQPHRT